MTAATITELAAGRARRTKRGHTISYGEGRVCESPGCDTILSRYNDATYCWLHEAA